MQPFETKELNFLFVLNELACLACFSVSCTFLFPYSDQEGVKICKNPISILLTYSIIAWVLISLVSACIVINFGFIIKDVVLKFVKLFKMIFAFFKTYKQQLLNWKNKLLNLGKEKGVSKEQIYI